MKRFVLVLISLATCLYAAAQGTAMDFIRADRNPATLGTAGAGYASTESGTAFSALGNVSAVPLATQKLHAAGTFGLAPAGEGQAFSYGSGVSFKLGRIGIAAACVGSNYPEVPLYSDGGGASGRFAPMDVTVGLGFSVAVTDYISIGALARYAAQTLDSKNTLSSLNADVMAMYKRDALSISAGVIALGSNVESISNRKYSLPASARLAAAYELGFGDFALDILADGDYYFSGNMSAAAGVQADWRKMVFLRTGYRYSSVADNFIAAPVPSFFSVGAGVKLVGISLDVAWISSGTLAASLGYSF